MKPEGSTYARARSTHRKEKEFEQRFAKVVAIGVRVSYESLTYEEI